MNPFRRKQVHELENFASVISNKLFRFVPVVLFLHPSQLKILTGAYFPWGLETQFKGGFSEWLKLPVFSPNNLFPKMKKILTHKRYKMCFFTAKPRDLIMFLPCKGGHAYVHNQLSLWLNSSHLFEKSTLMGKHLFPSIKEWSGRWKSEISMVILIKVFMPC